MQFNDAIIDATRYLEKLTIVQLILKRCNLQLNEVFPKRIDVNERITWVAALLKRTLGVDIVLTLDLAQSAWPARADAAQLDSCIVNLVNNARDAMRHGGSLTIATRNVHLDAAYASDNPDATPGDYLLVEVADTGVGMTPETAARAFEPFYTTNEAGHGTGLGLSMVFGFVKQSDGHVKIYSEVGRGAVVRVYLPRDGGEGDAFDLRSADEVAPGGGSEAALVVEDNEQMREPAVAQLRELGYGVIEAANADDALAVLDGGHVSTCCSRTSSWPEC